MAKATLDETDEVIEKLRDAVDYMSQFELYRDKLASVDLEPRDIDSIATFREIPPMDAEELANDFMENPPFGSLIPPDKKVVRVNFTPNPYMEDMLPVVTTQDEIASQDGSLYRSLGVTEDDVVLSTGSMTPYPMGWGVAGSCEAIGATYLPTGPGDSAQQARLVEKFGVTAVVGFPSFLLQIADQVESQEALDAVDLVVAVGEPFTAIEGYRERVRDAFGGDATVVDGYGLSEVGGVAHETPAEDGMHVFTDEVFPEVIDPETGELVERGEKGDLVVTHVSETAVPVLRFRTYDLTILDKQDGDYVLPEGVFGRTDNMQKVKGVKVYPQEILFELAGIEGVDSDNVQFRIVRPRDATQNFEMTVAADPDVVDRDEVVRAIEAVANISLDDLVIDEDFEVAEGEQIVDEAAS